MKKLAYEKIAGLTSAPLVDSHVHLDSSAYEEDWRDVWREAQKHSLRALVLPSTNLPSTRKIAQMCEEQPLFHATVGFHPHQAEEFDPDSSPSLMQDYLDGACAIGETGLEAHYDFCSWDKQLVSLGYHLELAKERDLPLILHCREAESQLYDQLLKSGPFPAGGVVHCYTGTWEMAQRFLQLGFHLGVNGIVTLASASQVHEVVQKSPLDRLLLETDGPYLAPRPFRGFRNEPALIPTIAKSVADLRDDKIDNIAVATSRNSKLLFRLALEV